MTGRRSKPAELTPQSNAYVIIHDLKNQAFFQIFATFYQILDILIFCPIIYAQTKKRGVHMFDKIKTLFTKGKKTNQTDNLSLPVIPKSRYSFVKQYVITDPNYVMVDGYKTWGLCKYTPVAYDNQDSTSGWLNAVQLPTEWALPFLKTLKNSAPEIRNDPRQRLISVIQLAENRKLYILPSLKQKKGSVIISWNNQNSKNKGDWVMYVTPEINRAIVEQAKIRSRN